MPTYPLRTFFASWAARTHSQARFLVKHRAKLIAICAIAAPTQVAALTAGIEGAIALDALVEGIHSLIDPAAAPWE